MNWHWLLLIGLFGVTRDCNTKAELHTCVEMNGD